MSSDLKVFGDGPRTASDGTVFSCYTVEWKGEGYPEVIELGDATYLLVEDCFGNPIKRRSSDGKA
ncbi:MAG: hypothetical protein J6D54_03505 [Olsenella sp.]|nr:hypothetical protein [Olsenella sp.]